MRPTKPNKLQLETLRWLHRVKPWGRAAGRRIQTVHALKRRGLVVWGEHGWVLTPSGVATLERTEER